MSFHLFVFLTSKATTESYTYCHHLSLTAALPVVGRDGRQEDDDRHGEERGEPDRRDPPQRDEPEGEQQAGGRDGADPPRAAERPRRQDPDRKSTRLNSSH